MTTTPIPLKRITLYKNNLGYFERTTNNSTKRSLIQVAKQHKKLVIDTLCTTASEVTFDTEEHNKYVAENTVEQFFSFNSVTSTFSFASFLNSCLGADITLFTNGNSKEQTGKLVMIEEIPALLGPNSTEITKNHVLQIVSKDGFIRHIDRKYMTMCLCKQ